jgi:hypothetical protein
MAFALVVDADIASQLGPRTNVQTHQRVKLSVPVGKKIFRRSSGAPIVRLVWIPFGRLQRQSVYLVIVISQSGIPWLLEISLSKQKEVNAIKQWSLQL